jgi:hypothetical protein
MKTEQSPRIVRLLAAALVLGKAAAQSAGTQITQAPSSVLDLEGQLLNMISAGAGLDLTVSPLKNATVLDADVDQLSQGLAKLKLKSGGKATPEMAGFVKTVNGMIDDDMTPKIKKAHKDDVTTLTRLDAAFLLCQGKKVSSDSRIKQLITKSALTTKYHRSCRQSEGRQWQLKDMCTKKVALLNRIMKSECQKQRLLWRNPNTEANYCHTTKRPEPYKLWLRRNLRWFSGKEGTYLRQKAKCEKATVDYKREKPICDRTVAAWKRQQNACNNRQSTLEGDTCSAGRQHQASCKEYRKCYSDALRAKYAQMPVIKKNEKDRKTEWRGLKRISCLLNVFATDESEPSVEVIDKCKQKTHDTTILNIAYKRAPARQRCGASPTVPCSTSFHRTYYWRLPSRGQPKRCKPCAIKTSGFGTDPTYWLTAENFLPKQNVWINKGTGPNIQNVVTSGKAHMELISGDGANSPLVAMTGGTSTTLRFGRVVPRQYTICSLTKYTGNRYRGRILQGAGVNWLHGHWASRKGVAYYNGWKTQHSARRSLTRNNDWSAVCGKSYGRAPYNLLVDGKPQGIATTNNVYPHGGLYVNGGAHGNEKSAFAIGDIMIWDTPLSNFHMQKAMNYLMGKLKQKASNSVINKRKAIVKQDIRPVYWLTADGFRPNENKWVNKGTGKSIRNVIPNYSKRPVVQLSSGYGARAQILSVNGDIDTALDFGMLTAKPGFTMCSLTRYTGRHRGRILTAKNNNVLLGHWANRVGVAYMTGWKTSTSNKFGLFNWLAFCATDRGPSGPNIIANGKEIGQYPHGSRPLRNVVINDKRGLWRNERSDFAVAEIKVWDQPLSKYTMQAEMKKLMGKLSARTSSMQKLKLRKLQIEANSKDEKL